MILRVVYSRLSSLYGGVDWVLLAAVTPLFLVGLFTMYSFRGENTFFDKQVIWGLVSLTVFFTASRIDWRFLRETRTVFLLFLAICGFLILLFVVGDVTKGARSWFELAGFSFQPAEVAKLVLILILAKYFSRRHVEIAHFRHIFVSGFYALLLFFLVLLQPDFGGAIILFLVWFGMVLVSGISRRHLLLVFLAAAAAFSFLWFFIFADYQKQRVVTFLNPLADVRGAGYNAFQSMVAVGSGGVVGKGIGYGTQSRLRFLPEYQTDFIFAAFAEEWGFVGVLLLFFLFGVSVWRILRMAERGATNFEVLFGTGTAVLFTGQFVVHVGMNIGLLPVTGVTLPFLSYGGTHLVVSFLALGILSGMRRYSRPMHRESAERELIGAM